MQVNINNIHIRMEIPDDYHAVEELTRDAFWKTFWNMGQVICDEHLLVHLLRKTDTFIPELSLVAECGSRLLGHIIYSKGKVVEDSGVSHDLLTFGPLSVHPSYQGMGIGKLLLQESFRYAKSLGYRGVIIFGHPDYYTRFGMRPAAEYGITTSDGKSFDSFMAYPLYDGALDGISGKFNLPDVYKSLTQEEAIEFDKRFPKKQPHKLVPIDVLLERLEPTASEAVKKLNFSCLAEMQTKSTREMINLDGINDNALATIRNVMNEHSMHWGKSDTTATIG